MACYCLCPIALCQWYSLSVLITNPQIPSRLRYSVSSQKKNFAGMEDFFFFLDYRETDIVNLRIF